MSAIEDWGHAIARRQALETVLVEATGQPIFEQTAQVAGEALLKAEEEEECQRQNFIEAAGG